MGKAAINGIIVGIVIIVSIVSIVYGLNNPNGLLHSVLSTHKENLVDASIVVPPSQFISYSVTAPPDSNNCKIIGTFSARGGNHDIVVYVVDQNGFIDLQQGNRFNTYFSTPQQISGNFDVSVPCDKKIHVVFSNTFSIITSKTVTTKVDFQYER